MKGRNIIAIASIISLGVISPAIAQSPEPLRGIQPQDLQIRSYPQDFFETGRRQFDQEIQRLLQPTSSSDKKLLQIKELPPLEPNNLSRENFRASVLTARISNCRSRKKINCRTSKLHELPLENFYMLSSIWQS